uniref:THUMP domain-containing protein n=1 Tax=Glossina brevipalpis TaxID=37001 RepID=A0A1A9W7N4_9MUSC
MGPPLAKRRKIQIQYRDNKKNKSYKSRKEQFLESGQRGFLATCNSNEWDCVKECYNVLNQYADILYRIHEGEMKPDFKKQTEQRDADIEEESDTDDDIDIADDLQKQIKASKEKGKERFQVVETGVSKCIFIKTILENPVPLATHIIEDILKSKKQVSRYLIRLIPIQAVCSIGKASIVKAATRICDNYFQTEPTTFSIVYNKSYKHNIDREDLIKELATLIHTKNANHKVDLKYPKKTLFIQLLKNLCCLSIIDNYMKYKKYNLIELARAEECPNMVETKVETEKEVVNSAEKIVAGNAAEIKFGDDDEIENENAEAEKKIACEKEKLTEVEAKNTKDIIKSADDY